jgi:hypothetical integral membrane protein (TIGR02206 family)
MLRPSQLVMLAADFHTWNLAHIFTLLLCLAAATGLVILGGRLSREQDRRRLRLFVGWGCLVVWALNTIYWAMPVRFALDASLPIHFCNVANIFGALAILRGLRLFQGVIYFWGCLYIWAFLTPTVGMGPAQLGYWVFWIYHLFILFAFVHLLFLDRFRPSWRDLLHSSAFTLLYLTLLIVTDALTGWNYGFLGKSNPGSPTPVDLLGPYPLRIVWMILCGALLFLLFWLPFCKLPADHSTTRTRK